jgi:hypothetical protein
MIKRTTNIRDEEGGLSMMVGCLTSAVLSALDFNGNTDWVVYVCTCVALYMTYWVENCLVMAACWV